MIFLKIKKSFEDWNPLDSQYMVKNEITFFLNCQNCMKIGHAQGILRFALRTAKLTLPKLTKS